MKHFLYISILFFLIINFIVAEDIIGFRQLIVPQIQMEIEKDKIVITKYDKETSKEEVKYSLQLIDSIQFLLFNYQGDILDFIPKGEQKWLVLYSKEFGIMYAFNGNKEPLKQGFLGKNNLIIGFTLYNYSSTSSLIENNTEYKPENLGLTTLGHPWVEGSPGDGIGEKITIEGGKKISGIIISNGFVSYNKLYLYEDNARAKEIHITDSNMTIDQVIKLKDSPNLQVIRFDKIVENIIIEIVSSYPGKKYTDMCINFILPIEVF